MASYNNGYYIINYRIDQYADSTKATVTTIKHVGGQIFEILTITFDGKSIYSGDPAGRVSGKTATINKSASVTKTHTAQTKQLAISGGGATKNINVSVPAKTSYKVTLNANGGTGGTASLTKWYGETLSLTSGFTAPTRTGYKFVGWGETSTATDTASQYTGNAAKTYYAVWEKQITGISLNVTTLRVADGTATAEDDEGTWCYGTCTYSVTGTAAADVVFTVSVTPNTPQIVQNTFTATKTEDNTLTGSFVFRASGCATDASYTFMVAATANNTSATQTVTKSHGNVLSMAYYVLDVLGDNYEDSGQRPAHGISFGAPCKDEGFHVAMPADFGTFPDKDPSTYALVIGNGTSDTARSNALTTDWNGYTRTGADAYKVLWKGALFMHGTQTISLAENISGQGHGIVLVWSRYDTTNHVARDEQFTYSFIPKYHVALFSGKGVACPISTPWAKASKYLYIADASITGHEWNDDTRTVGNVTDNNGAFVLRAVIGV